jgi:hypothetical protein
LSSFDHKCIAFYKFYTQTEANFYEKQDRSRPDLFDCGVNCYLLGVFVFEPSFSRKAAFLLEKTRLAHHVKFAEGPFQSYKKEILFQSALEVF